MGSGCVAADRYLDMPRRPATWIPVAARLLCALNAGSIVVLGGDGTNRVVAKGCGCIPSCDIHRHKQRLR